MTMLGFNVEPVPHIHMQLLYTPV